MQQAFSTVRGSFDDYCHNLYDRKDLESGLEEVAYENGFDNTSIAVATSIRQLDETLGAARLTLPPSDSQARRCKYLLKPQRRRSNL